MLAIDLFCGLGGWTDGLLAEGYRVVGFDIEAHDYRDGKRYPAQLVIQDVLTIHGRQFKDAALIVASPPCQEYSYMAMPWSRAKAIAGEYRSGKRDTKKLTALFDACFRIQREAIAAAGHFIPMVVENVRGAQPWVGRARWNFGSYYLWGDVPALMPITQPRKKGRSNFHQQFGLPSPAFHGADHESSVQRHEAYKTQGMNWSDRSIHGQDFTRIAGQQAEGVKVESLSGRRTDVGNGARFTSRDCGKETEGVKQRGSGRDWFAGDGTMSGKISSKSPARKAASATIAKIPLTLAQWIARTWKPKQSTVVSCARAS